MALRSRVIQKANSQQMFSHIPQYLCLIWVFVSGCVCVGISWWDCILEVESWTLGSFLNTRKYKKSSALPRTLHRNQTDTGVNDESSGSSTAGLDKGWTEVIKACGVTACTLLTCCSLKLKQFSLPASLTQKCQAGCEHFFNLHYFTYIFGSLLIQQNHLKI